MVRFDLQGIGTKDTALLGYQGAKEGVLAIVRGKKAEAGKVLYFPFAISGSSSLGVCARPIHLEVMPATCERDQGPIAGCTLNQRAQELVVIGGDCDPLHIYWDPQQGSLDWWRL
ncbi:hypothetical protein [Inhella gelatinilytica]|uniref:Uncharacterized protein n=1 Tax=Inhella gelatinilytica TaxID=2795030 RepID=A0A931ITQ4_9BURK|nr:hypothetical protein [Inhella gelatinilytica]MBH9551964.1 hypothetical protein [Inhella gelatinilytica]